MKKKRIIGIILIVAAILWFLVGWTLSYRVIDILMEMAGFEIQFWTNEAYYSVVQAFQNGTNLVALLLGILGISFMKKEQ